MPRHAINSISDQPIIDRLTGVVNRENSNNKKTDKAALIKCCHRSLPASHVLLSARQRGVELLKVKELAGHKSITTTLRYAHLASENLKEAIKVLDQPRLKIG